MQKFEYLHTWRGSLQATNFMANINQNNLTKSVTLNQN